MMLHWNVDIDVIKEKYLKFEEMIPQDLVLYGQDYLATDLEDRLRKGYSGTHPKFETVYTML